MRAMTHDRLVLTNANVIDCVGEQSIVGGSVVIERGRIREVLDGTHSADTRNADVIDLKGAYLLPGLWDVELGLWVKDGATPRQALLAATRDAAELCGVGAELGTIQPGKLADLIVVDDDPLRDITNLRRLRLVFKEGRLVSDRRAGAIGRRKDS